jgi:signal transduction histidine kinase
MIDFRSGGVFMTRAGIREVINMLWSELNLRKKLSIVFVIMTVFPLVLVTIITSWMTGHTMENFAVQRNKDVAEIIANDINHMFLEKVRLIEVLTDTPDILSRDRQRQFAAIRGIANQYPDIQNIIVVDTATAKQAVRSDGRKIDIEISNREYFKAAKAGNLFISDIITSKVTGTKNIIIAEPIQGDDQTIHEILIMSVNIQKIIDIIAKTKIGNTGYTFIVNGEGRSLIHPDVEEGTDLSYLPSVKAVISGQRGSTQSEFKGQKRLDGYSYIPITKWGLIAQQPLDEAMTDVNNVEKTNILILACSAAIAVLMGLAMANGVAKPIAKISKAAESLAEGNVTTSLPITSQDEIGRLASTFNNMTTQIKTRDEALRQARDDLEIKIEERTQELFAANEELMAMNEELQNSYAGLETEVIQRVQAVEQVEQINRQLEKAFTELKNAQSQIIQQEKMASIGQLAAGVAHEINNPMAFIISNLGSLKKYSNKIIQFVSSQEKALAELVKVEGADNETMASIHKNIEETKRSLKIDFIMRDIEELLTEALEGADRVKIIIQDLKGFARIANESAMADINEGIESTINIIWNELKYKAKLEKEFSKIPLTKCNLGQLNQVFMNILLNAVQAIEIQGEIRVKTWTESNSIFISIADTGTGIPSEILTRIFEPFFTTKEVGKGTGLGLSVTYDIIKRHEGEIRVESELGKGTTFTIIIPVVQG